MDAYHVPPKYEYIVNNVFCPQVNSNDDDGILVGRWDGEYSEGTAPSAWTGSVPIIEQYFQTMKSVKYGQCWVFAGVLSTSKQFAICIIQLNLSFISSYHSGEIKFMRSFTKESHAYTQSCSFHVVMHAMPTLLYIQLFKISWDLRIYIEKMVKPKPIWAHTIEKVVRDCVSHYIAKLLPIAIRHTWL